MRPEPGVLRLDAVIQARGPAAAIVLTDEQVAALTDKKAFQVSVAVDGRRFDGRVARMGGENLIGLSKAARADPGVEIGDQVAVQITVQAAPRALELPPELERALAADPAARARFDALAPSHRREHARAVAEAAKPDTRARRVAKVLDALR